MAGGAVTYETVKELARILRPSVGQSPHHVKTTMDFIQRIKNIKLQWDECICSNDVKALLTSMPTDQAIIKIKKLKQDKEFPSRTTMSIGNNTSLLEFCLRDTYYLFQGKYYE